jgi:hypothetical protein
LPTGVRSCRRCWDLGPFVIWLHRLPRNLGYERRFRIKERWKNVLLKIITSHIINVKIFFFRQNGIPLFFTHGDRDRWDTFQMRMSRMIKDSNDRRNLKIS